MRFLRPALIVALLCVATAGATFADDIHVVFDPTTSTAPLNGFTNIITSLTPPIAFTWFACSSNPDISGVFPLAPALSGETACAEFANDTGMNITSINFAFTANPLIPGADSVSCSNVQGDPHLSSATCGPDGPLFNITFSGGTPIVPTVGTVESLFFIGEDGVAVTDINNLGWTASAPEPGSLTLLAAGMGLVGLCMVFAKR
jgi:PEP-CTERM motif